MSTMVGNRGKAREGVTSLCLDSTHHQRYGGTSTAYIHCLACTILYFTVRIQYLQYRLEAGSPSVSLCNCCDAVVDSKGSQARDLIASQDNYRQVLQRYPTQCIARACHTTGLSTAESAKQTHQRYHVPYRTLVPSSRSAYRYLDTDIALRIPRPRFQPSLQGARIDPVSRNTTACRA
jgi:arginine/lysine/ornithine decarboxylase